MVSYKRTVRGSTRAVDAFDELIAGLRPGLARAFAAAYGRDRGEDALAEALAWAYEHRSRLLAMENPGGYLYRVGQSRSRVRRDSGHAFPAPAVLGLPDVEPGLPDALASLSDRQRACLALVVVDEWTYEEVAALLGIKRSSVQSHVERALHKLRKGLGVDQHADV